ncbi:MAG: hypothetical protein LAQ30_20325 [Acidobacteriia bacterium]|nr:hypothetical protein [Terriglobia bacterium]
MFGRFLACALACACLLSAAKKVTVATAKGENEAVGLTVTLHIDPQDVKQLIGSDLEGHYIVAEVKIEPKYGKEVVIDRDDFQLWSDKDAEKTKPFAPSQIAGSGALIVRQTRTAAGGGGPTIGPTYPGGGYPGGYPPPVYPGGGPPGAPPVTGPGGVGVGGGGGDAEGAAATVQNTPGKPNPLEKTLKEKELPQVKTAKPASGLLYFGMEKQKMKDLQLTYGGRDERITLRFK